MFMLKLIAKLFGTKSEKDIKRIMPLVQQANQEGQKLVSLSNDELRNETRKLQDFINQELKAVDDKLAGLHQKIANDKSLEINEKEAVLPRSTNSKPSAIRNSKKYCSKCCRQLSPLCAKQPAALRKTKPSK